MGLNSKFGSLAADVSAPFKVEILDPATDQPIKDSAGQVAYVSVYSVDSERARAFDREQRKKLRQRVMQSRSGRVEPDDQVEENMSKCAHLTAAWHLVDPETKEALDLACSPENAADLYSEPGAGWLFTQVWLGAINIANFMKRASASSSPTPITSSTSSAN